MENSPFKSVVVAPSAPFIMMVAADSGDEFDWSSTFPVILFCAAPMIVVPRDNSNKITFLIVAAFVSVMK